MKNMISQDSSYKFLLYIIIAFFTVSSCSTNDKGPVFEKLPASKTNIVFNNSLEYDEDFNIYTYRNFYNGGGVAIGDVNNDGLPDIYFTANMKDNRLFLNKGNFEFEDITEQSGVAGERAWSTGVSMADVNGDGFLDIYVSNSGDVKGDNKQNELFINNGDLTFTEMAEEYAVADRGFSTHAAFFDYDRDGDLDMYLLNNSYRAIGSFNLQRNERSERDPIGGDKLYRNDGDHFTDVSQEAGIYGSVIGFGLGVTVSDFNKDNWPDMYISNDFFERDYLYINNKDGTFEEVLERSIQSISGASMGADAVDINHDGYPEIFVTEMLPEPDERLKTVTTFENWDKYQFNFQNDYYHQFTRNMLQLNRGDGTFAEVGRLAGVEATDWSWAALMADLDHNGHTDIFVANGIYQDLTNQDYIKYASSDEIIQRVTSGKNVDYKQLIDLIPSNPVPNYAFSGGDGLEFTNRAAEWGLGEASFSNGSAYGDLDNDGDLDLVINNVNMEAFVYRNRTAEQGGAGANWLSVRLEGSPPNTHGVGAQLSVWSGGRLWWREQIPQRGFQSSVDPRLHVGLGGAQTVDSLQVVWPDGSGQRLYDVGVNQRLVLRQSEAQPTGTGGGQELSAGPFPPMLKQAGQAGPEWSHRENEFVDFDRDRLLFHMRSTEGPAACAGDVDGDGFDELYLGGAKDQPGSLWKAAGDGRWQQISAPVLAADSPSEDTGCVFFDADGDGAPDLYVASGGSEFSSSSAALADRLYLNTEQGWQASQGLEPVTRFMPTGAVAAGDVDGDGDMDLFVGERMQPFAFGLPVDGRLLENEGGGRFRDVTARWAPQLEQSGMFTGGQWVDADGDGDLDLVTAGEWMRIELHRNLLAESGAPRLEPATAAAGLDSTRGWWNELVVGDVDGDGDTDLVGLNHGLNSRFSASRERPVSLWVNDFDRNGSIEQILSVWNGPASYPVVLRHDLVEQLPGLKKKYLKYEAYKEQTMEDIFTPQQLERALRLEAYTLASRVFWNDGSGSFSSRELPVRAQFAPMYAGLAGDVSGDGAPELLVGGNLWEATPQAGRYDASRGVMLRAAGSGQMESIPDARSGFVVEGQLRGLLQVRTPEGPRVIAVRNNDRPVWFKINSSAFN